MKHFRAIVIFLAVAAVSAFAQDAGRIEAGKRRFEARCGGCHGADGKGGVRGPDIVTPGLAAQRSDEEVRKLVREGFPDRGMPGIDLGPEEMGELAAFYLSLTAPASRTPVAGDVEAGRRIFFGEGGCSLCHWRGEQAEVIGPDLSAVGASRTRGEIEQSLRDPDAVILEGYGVVEAILRDGSAVSGFARNESLFDLQLQTFDGRFRFLRTEQIASISRRDRSLMPQPPLGEKALQDLLAYLSRLDGTGAGGTKPLGGALGFDRIVAPAEGDWPTYNGRLSGNRHSRLREINAGNVSQLEAKWVFPIDAPRELEMTPLVVDSVMYVTGANEARALDARNGREIWSYKRPRTPGVMGDAGSGANRGLALLGDRLFMATDNAHMIALDRVTGRLLWDREMADYREHYGGTLAPLVVKDLVIGGVGGGDEGIRGFLAAYRADTGEEAWRFWTVPLPGEPLSETWKGSVLPHGCAGTWLTGTYDPELNLLYWPTGNPCPDMNGDERLGDNLYSASILALDADTGELKWHYQYSPHDEFDFDANQTPVLVDAEWKGRPRKLLLHANRNGFFYVLDRTNGELLRAEPFVEKLDWASTIGADGRPILNPDRRPTPAGNIVCPGMAGATNWMSPAYDPNHGLYIVQTIEFCQIYTKREEIWQKGKAFFGGVSKNVPGEPPVKHLRAIDLATGQVRWNVRQRGQGRNWAGALSTDGDVVFYGDDSGAFAAARASDGETLWHFHLNVKRHASPMTYLAGGRQFVAIAAGRMIVAFGLPE